MTCIAFSVIAGFPIAYIQVTISSSIFLAQVGMRDESILRRDSCPVSAILVRDTLTSICQTQSQDLGFRVYSRQGVSSFLLFILFEVKLWLFHHPLSSSVTQHMYTYIPWSSQGSHSQNCSNNYNPCLWYCYWLNRAQHVGLSLRYGACTIQDSVHSGKFWSCNPLCLFPKNAQYVKGNLSKQCLDVEMLGIAWRSCLWDVWILTYMFYRKLTL